MSNRTEAVRRKPPLKPPGGYSYCACSRLHPTRLHKTLRHFEPIFILRCESLVTMTYM